PLRLDPEPRFRPVREPRIVPPLGVGVEPASLEQRAHDIATVAQHVYGERFGIRLERCVEDVRRLGRLLDAAQSPREPHPPDPLEDPSQVVCRRAGRERRLPRRHLAKVDEAWEAADRAAEERRPRPRAADVKDEPLLAPEPGPLHEGPLGDSDASGAVIHESTHSASGSESGTRPRPCPSGSITCWASASSEASSSISSRGTSKVTRTGERAVEERATVSTSSVVSAVRSRYSSRASLRPGSNRSAAERRR